VLAWPETLCKQAGAWYDNLMHFMGINDGGYYKVGHAAIILVEDKSGKCNYFDFGRYHAPQGNGRVRSTITDHDLKINSKAKIENREIHNLDEILLELFHNPSTHGTGTIYGSVVRINFSKAYQYALTLQKKDYIPYGPFITGGTNCSRFVNTVLRNGDLPMTKKILLKLPWMLTPTPMWNLKAVQSVIKKIGDYSHSEELFGTNTSEILFNT